ncbi:MAG: single-stranded DNA-binding protein [Prevotella sp.]|jgi:single-strand DNA-binding protein|nr:single-stranded DNA-binding protein [Prevotella sp.]MCI2080342.1 single-stranded DNA-binding protein [Prevotella sp.]MCI2102187.1 single-stranded DNA-binding protein [Prevotella sp.]HCN54545.1 single-stranded DNA-binding protein [Prevotella sp.]
MNKVMLIGNVGKDPDVRYYDTDQAVATFPLATTEKGYVLQNGTKVPDHTDWHNIVLWRGLAKVAEKYVHKGDKLFIEGRIRYRQYDDQKGQRRYVTEILGENMELLSPKPIETTSNQTGTVVSEPTATPEGSADNLPF